jgi:hypothetical protein
MPDHAVAQPPSFNTGFIAPSAWGPLLALVLVIAVLGLTFYPGMRRAVGANAPQHSTVLSEDGAQSTDELKVDSHVASCLLVTNKVLPLISSGNQQRLDDLARRIGAPGCGTQGAFVALLVVFSACGTLGLLLASWIASIRRFGSNYPGREGNGRILQRWEPYVVLSVIAGAPIVLRMTTDTDGLALAAVLVTQALVYAWALVRVFGESQRQSRYTERSPA